MKMPLGRYEGEEVDLLPSDYLKWLMENWDGDSIREEAEEEFSRRTDERSHFYE